MFYRADVNMTQGEAVYKAAARIQKYGVEAFVKMLGEKAIKARGGRARLLKYYTEKYPEAPLTLEPKAPSISERMKSYWRDVKLIAEGHGITDKEARKILKREKEDRDVRVQITKTVKGWQLYILGEFKNTETAETATAEGFSRLYDNRDNHEEALNECIKSALNSLGGAMFGDGYADIEDSDWFLVEILKERWNRFYGRIPT
jgi:hypothetical protein